MAKAQAQPGSNCEPSQYQQQIPEKPEMIEMLGPSKGVEVAAGKSPMGEWDDGEHANQQGQADVLDPGNSHLAESTPLPINGREEPAEHEKQGHRKPVDGAEDVNVGLAESSVSRRRGESQARSRRKGSGRRRRSVQPAAAWQGRATPPNSENCSAREEFISLLADSSDISRHPRFPDAAGADHGRTGFPPFVESPSRS